MTFKRRVGAAVRAFRDPRRVVPVNSITGEPKQLAARQAVEGAAWKTAPGRWDRINKIATDALQSAGLTGGKMLEIGCHRSPHKTDFPAFDYTALDLKEPAPANVAFLKGDITHCPEIPDDSFDFILSVDVFQHIDRPWLAAAEIRRLLRPGGVTVHTTPFSWRYTPCPIDYWRFTAPGLKSLFDGLECLYSEFDDVERRRDMRGRDKNAVKVDSFGGWRENVRVHYAGMKPKAV